MRSDPRLHPARCRLFRLVRVPVARDRVKEILHKSSTLACFQVRRIGVPQCPCTEAREQGLAVGTCECRHLRERIGDHAAWRRDHYRPASIPGPVRARIEDAAERLREAAGVEGMRGGSGDCTAAQCRHLNQSVTAAQVDWLGIRPEAAQVAAGIDYRLRATAPP